MKIAIIYHSVTGNTEKSALLVAKGAEKVEGVETKLMTIDNIDEDFVKESKIVFFGTPTYSGSYSWQMKKFLDTIKIKLAGKVGCVFATANFVGGGADHGELALISELLVKGMFVYTVGTSEGLPYTHFGAVMIKDGTEDQKKRIEIYAERVATKVNELFK